ncbi:helix-turn-helix domain-containing protein [Croceitalea marina]|uniref:helix-turn-helix domain-containing protein n=1 Tax=Croceitalea marina TaxID=1775166 RepID=UPI00366E525A
MFLFSLSFFNLIYAFHILGIEKFAGIPVSSFPFPYKYLIGVGFYFYIKSQVFKDKNTILKKEYLLFLPALFYGVLRMYWYVNLHTGIDKDIFFKVYKTGFFVYNEFAYLIFNLVLVFFSIRFLRRNSTEIKGLRKVRKNWNWLLKFSYVFTAFTIVNLIHQVLVTIAGLQDNGQLYLIILVINTIYIYWVGLESLTKSQFLFNQFSLKQHSNNTSKPSHSLAHKFEDYIAKEEIFTNKSLKVSDFAPLLNVTEKELSLYIHETFDMSFSDYINQQRVEKVKKQLQSDDQKKYTLVAIAENAGFSSKSSFNAVFKKFTGLTPSQYKSTLKK